MTTGKSRWIPWLFVTPALFLLTIFLVYPTLQTIWLSFHRGTIIRPMSEFVGVENYVKLLTNDRFFLKADTWPPSGALVNTIVWLLLFPAGTVLLGLLIAVLADRVRYENIIKSIIFMPMVISATAASVIFRFVYSPDPNTGVLNAVLTRLFPSLGPIPWLGRADLANLAVIGAGIWLWTGLAMTVLSAAYKALPTEMLEAAAIDGANAWQTFWRVAIPMLARPIAFIATTMIINALKMVSLILVMTRGAPGGATRIIGFTVYWEMFNNTRLGYGSAVAVILFVLIIPFMAIQIRSIRAEEVLR